MTRNLALSIAIGAIVAAAGCSVGGGTHSAGPGDLAQGPGTQLRPYVIQSQPPSVYIEFPIPTASSEPEGLTVGSDRQVYFTEFAGNKIGRITQAGVITEFPIPTADAGASFIAADGKGALWFNEINADKIGKMLFNGTFTEYLIPTASSQPYAVAFTTSNKGVWFTELAGNKIGTIVVKTGKLTEYTLPEPNSQPGGIIAGPNGEIWFTELNAARIGQINTATGLIKEFAVPAPGQFINKNKYGDLYFTMPSLQAVGEITTDGQYVTDFPSGVSPSEPWGLTGGNNRIDIWYLDRSYNAVMSFNTFNHSLVPFVIPTAGSDPYHLQMSRDNNLWFTENAGNKIGVYVRYRLSITPSSLTFTSIGQMQSFSVVERKYSGQFTTTGCSPNIATISAGPATTFTVTAAGVGSCTITVHDPFDNYSNVPVV